MVHIKGYLFDTKYNWNGNEKKFYFFNKSPGFINLLTISIYIRDTKLVIELEDYYNDTKNIIDQLPIHKSINTIELLDLIQISTDLKIISICDGKFIYFINVEETLKNNKLLFYEFKLQYLTSNISKLLLINNKIIVLNNNTNYFIVDLYKNTSLLKSYTYSREIFIKMSKNNKFIIVKNNNNYELINIDEQNKYNLPTNEIKDTVKKIFLISDIGNCYIIQENKLIICNKTTNKSFNISIKDFNIDNFVIDINTYIHDISYIHQDYIIFFCPKTNIYNLTFISTDNLYVNQMKISNESENLKYLYINNNIYYHINENNINIVNMNTYTIFGLLLTIIEINNKSLGKKLYESVNSQNLIELSDLYSIKPIGGNIKYLDMTMNDFIKNMISQYNIIQVLSYELALEHTSERFMEDIFECIINFKKNIINKMDQKYVIYVELLLILFLYCYHLELPNKKNIISILKINKKNKYKNNNICGYRYPIGFFEKIFDNNIHTKQLLCDSIESSLFY